MGLLRQDTVIEEKAVLRLIKVPLFGCQCDVLISFTYNLDAAALPCKVNREEHGEVPQEFMRWVFGGERKLIWRVRRRHSEAALYQNEPMRW